MADGKVFPEAVTSYIGKVAAEKGVPAELAIGILGGETNGNLNPGRTSPKGARGLWQLMPSFVEQTGRDPKSFKYEDEVHSTEAALDGIKQLWDKYKDPSLVVAAYNAGPTTVDNIIKSGGDLPAETKKYLKNVDEWSGGFLSNPRKEEPPAPPVQSIEQQVNTPTPSREEAMAAIPQNDENSISTEESTSGLQAGANAVLNVGKSAVNYLTQFPRESVAYIGDRTGISGLGQRAGTVVGNAIGNLVGLPDKGPMPAIPPPQIDPTGALNFVTLPLGMGSGRVANAGIGATQAFYQDLDARARNTAQQEGIDWETLGFGERASRIIDQLNWAVFDDKMALNMAAGAFLGGAFGGKPTEPGDLSNDIGLIRAPIDPKKMTPAELKAYEAARAGAEEARKANIAIDMEAAANEDAIRAYHEGLPRAVSWNYYAGKENAATQKAYTNEVAAAKGARDISEAGVYAENANRAAQYDDQVRQLEAPYQEALQRHNDIVDSLAERAGIPRLPATAGELEKTAYNQRLKARFMQEVGLPPEDPSTAVYQGWLGSRETGYSPAALEPVSQEVVDRANTQLAKIAKEGTAQDALGAKLSKLGRALDDPKGVKPKIAEIEARMAKLPPNEPRWQSLADKREQLKAQLVPVRKIDLIDRAQAIAKAQRSVLFRDAANANEARLITDAKKALYGDGNTGGLVEQALSAEEAATWRRANALSRDYRVRDRMATLVANAFGDARNGAKNIRNTLGARERTLKKAFGEARYNELLDLARTLDGLNAGAPPLRPPAEAYPRRPQSLKVKDIIGKAPKVPEPPTEIPYLDIPKEPSKITFRHEPTPTLPDYDPDRHYKIRAFISGLNSVFGTNKVERVLKITAAPAALYGYQHGVQGAGILLAGMSAELMRSLLTNRVARREFNVMAAHLDNMTSNEFSHAFAKFATAVTVQQLHEQEAGIDQQDQLPTPVEQATELAGKLPPPSAPPQATPPPALPVPTRRTGKVAAR